MALPPKATLGINSLIGREVLAGRKQGEADWHAIRSHLARENGAELLEVDLSGVRFMSSSYFLACLWQLWSSDDVPAAVPVLTNPDGPVREEIEFALMHLERLAWVADGNGGATSPDLVGELDEETRTIFDLLRTRGSVTATELHTQDGKIGVTAWSTRLGLLHQRRLVVRHKEGKKMIYSLPWVVCHG